MVNLYLVPRRGREAASDKAIRALPLPGHLSWVDDPAWAALTLTSEATRGDYVVGVALSRSALEFQTLSDDHRAIVEAVRSRISRIPAPLRQVALGDWFAHGQIPQFVASLPVVPTGRFAAAARGALRVIADRLREPDASPDLLERLWSLVEGPLWARAEIRSLTELAWWALARSPHGWAHDALASRPFASNSVGRYAASDTRDGACTRRPSPEWLVAADRDVACFVLGALRGSFGVARSAPGAT